MADQKPTNKEVDHEGPLAGSPIQVSQERSHRFYSNLAKRMFAGDVREAQEEVTITGLGSAIRVAIAAAANLVADEGATYVKVETSYFSSQRTSRSIPRINIVLKRSATTKVAPPS